MNKAVDRSDLDSNLFVLTGTDIRLGNENVTEQAVWGTTYRAHETQMNTLLRNSLNAINTALSLASTLFTVAAADPVLLGLAPTAATNINLAANHINTAANQALAMANAILAFEANALAYLSNIVKVG